MSDVEREDGLQPDSAPDEAQGSATRRAFVLAAGTVAGAVYVGALGYPVYKYLGTAADEALAESAVKEVTLEAANLPTNAAMMFKFAGKPAMLIHQPDGSWTALSAVCTHLACTVAYQPDQQRIHCACHGGVYDPKTGNNVSGPPPKPLTLLHAELVEGKVKVTRA